MHTDLSRGLTLIVSRPCTLIESTTSCAVMLMETTREVEVGSYALYYCDWVSARTGSCILVPTRTDRGSSRL